MGSEQNLTEQYSETFATESKINWNDIKVYDQQIAGLILGDFNIIKEYDVPQEFNGLYETIIHKGLVVKKGGQEFLIPITDKFPPESAIRMISTYNQSVEDKYEKPVLIKKAVADDIFSNKTEVYIFLGETEEGVIFMIEDAVEKNYYIISNCDVKIQIDEITFLNYKSYYHKTLKSILDRYIQSELKDPTESNTKRFILGDIVYKKCIEKVEEDPTLDLVISCYPAIHMSNNIYKYRMTFIMILEAYNGIELFPLENIGVYDRNGLCPPGTC